MNFFSKKLLGHEIFIVLWSSGLQIKKKKIVKPFGPPSYILNVHSLPFLKNSNLVCLLYFRLFLWLTQNNLWLQFRSSFKRGS